MWNTHGAIALHERNLMIAVLLLMLVITVPALLLLWRFAVKYNAANIKSQKNPEDNHTSKLVFLFWGAPALIVLMLSGIIWHTAHTLDPYKSIDSQNPSITIQVVALRWKWLFIYPQQHIATVNFIQIPTNTPIHFELTADGPMNSFWIPQLGGQMYAMTGMSTNLNLIANSEGNFDGSAAEVNGQGFAGMKFVTQVRSQQAFDDWILKVQRAPTAFTKEVYSTLAMPSENEPKAVYSSIDENMYTSVIAQFMP